MPSPRLPIAALSCAMALIQGLADARAAPAAEIVLRSSRVKAVLGEDAAWKSLLERTTGLDVAPKQGVALASVVVDDKHYSASSAARDGDRLTVGFAGIDTQLVYQVSEDDDWIALELLEIRGPRPSRLTLVRIGVTLSGRVGRRLNAAWDDRLAVCLMGTSRRTAARPASRRGYTELAASSQDAPGPKLEGSCAALILAPRAELRPILRRLSVAFDMPRNEQDGVPSKELALARQSYWFLSFAEKDVDRVIDLCRRTGFRQVLLSSGSWCESPGHYTINTRAYPDGVESLRRTVRRFHAAGIRLNIHTFASKAAKRDAYVTPVPDRRFWVDRRATLAEAIDEEAAAIRTRDDLSQWPGSPACRQKTWEGGLEKHQEVILDDEIVQYASIGPEGRWDTFLGCKRGAWGTKAAGHEAGTEARHYGVDGCINGYILDQEASLFDETTSRLAALFDACDFDGLYFDGSEDVDRRRYDYYAANAHATVMAKITKRPVIHTGGGFHHNLWHSFTRSGTVDTYLNTLHGRIISGAAIEQWPTVRDHIDRSVRYVESLEADMIPGELGWFGIWPKGKHTDGLQLDEIEYLMGRALGLDAPVSLQSSFPQMERHGLTPGILQIVGAYERLRMSGKVPADVRKRLRPTGRDFILFHAAPAEGDRPPEFLGASPAEVAGGREVRAMLAQHGRGAVATVWHYLGRDGKLMIRSGGIKATDLFGHPIKAQVAGSETAVPLGPTRTTLLFPQKGAEEARKVLAAASFEARKPDVIRIEAEAFEASSGNMKKGSQAGITERGASGDVVVCDGRIRRIETSADWCEYRVTVPRKGLWTLWARVRYPSGGDMSFGLVPAGEKVTLERGQVLGNCGANEKKWHWTGRGGGVTTVPPGRPLVLKLAKGEFAFRVYPREGPGTAATNPRLDCILLCEDPSYVPTDGEAPQD